MAEEKKDEAKKIKLAPGRHLSAIKRHRQSIKRASRNRFVLSHLKSSIKKVRQAVAQKDKNLAETSLKNAMSALHKAASKKVIHRRNAARRISRLSSLVQSLSA